MQVYEDMPSPVCGQHHLGTTGADLPSYNPLARTSLPWIAREYAPFIVWSDFILGSVQISRRISNKKSKLNTGVPLTFSRPTTLHHAATGIPSWGFMSPIHAESRVMTRTVHSSPSLRGGPEAKKLAVYARTELRLFGKAGVKLREMERASHS